ncbi:MAG: hypothetical protein ACHQ2Y_01080 [Candidatus Lutacidiplasmatales archaeon]
MNEPAWPQRLWQSATPPGPDTASSVRGLWEALTRFQTLVVLGLAITVLSLIGSGLAAAWNWATIGATAPFPFGPWQTQGIPLAITALVGLGTAILVLICLVVAIRGFLFWRRSSRQLMTSATEFGEPHLSEAKAAWEDSRSALRWVFLAIGIAIALGITLGITNGVLVLSGQSAMPIQVTGSVSALGASAGFFLVYYFGTRQLVGGVRSLFPPASVEMMTSARSRILLGALVGIPGSLSSVFWPLGLISLASILIILSGINEILAQYEGWLRVHQLQPPRISSPLVGPSPKPA